MQIPNKVKRLFEKQSLVAFGTADKQGKPNVVPVFWKKIVKKERILLLDNFMRMSKKNLLENSNVCLTFWDVKTEESYKIKGKAAYHTEGAVYEQGRKFMQSKRPEAVPKGVVEIRVRAIYTTKPGPEAGRKL